MKRAALLTLLLAVGIAPANAAGGRAPGGPDTLIVKNGGLSLRALLFRPSGNGPFPAVLFNHGSGRAPESAAARLSPRYPEVIGPLFAKHGYVLLYLYRRGDGLSAGQGSPSGKLMDEELVARGQGARNRLQLELLENDEMSDALAGLARLRALSDVDPRRVAVVGHSFGGSLTLLMAARDGSLRAGVLFAPASSSWKNSNELRTRLLAAAERTRVPLMFVYAANDYSTQPGIALDAQMARHGGQHKLVIYPSGGGTPEEGHALIYLGVRTWEKDVFEFLDARLKRK